MPKSLKESRQQNQILMTMCLPFQQQECYELSPAAEITSFKLNLCVAKSGDGVVDGVAVITATQTVELPVVGSIKPVNGGYEIELNLKSSNIPLVESVQITINLNSQFQAISATYTIVFTNGTTVQGNGPAKSIPCS